MGRLKPRIKHISLEFMGEEWRDCYLDLRSLTWGDLAGFDAVNRATVTNREAGELITAALKRNFVAGQGLDAQGNTIDLTADDLADLDIDAQTEIYAQLGGQPSPKA